MIKPRQLLLMRHGKSDWSVEVSDFKRPLKKRGVKAAKKIGHWLTNQQRLRPDLIISSPAERAISTALIVSDALPGVELELDDRLYESDLERMLHMLSELPEDVQRPLVVGHNPGLERLLLYLCEVPADAYKDWKLLTTGTIAILELDVSWKTLSKHCAHYKKLIRGKDL